MKRMILLWLFVVISSISLNAQITDTFFSRDVRLGAKYKTCKTEILSQFPSARLLDKEFIELRNVYFGGTTWDVILLYFKNGKFQSIRCLKENGSKVYLETERALKEKYVQYLMIDNQEENNGRKETVFDDGERLCFIMLGNDDMLGNEVCQLVYDNTSLLQ